MKSLLFALGICLQIYGIPGIVIPDELPSLLSVIYSNIPLIKKGTDSRIGWGFRIGDRADFQVLVELGPQKYTQPLANEPDKVVSNKRHTMDDLATQLWAQRQEDKRREQEKQQKKKEETSSSDWLKTWSKGVRNRQPTIPQLGADEIRPGLGIGEIDAKSVIPADLERRILRRGKQINISSPSTTTTTKNQSEDAGAKGLNIKSAVLDEDDNVAVRIIKQMKFTTTTTKPTTEVPPFTSKKQNFENAVE